MSSEPELPDSAFVRVRVSRTIAETDAACSFELDIPPEAADRFSYRPGQFLTLRVPSDRTGSVGRCYSLSSTPHEDRPLTVTVKRIANGYASNWLCDNAGEGTALEVLPPAGVFTPRSLDEDLLLFAGGSGITPVMSILKSVLAAGTGKVALVYANRDENSVIFARELSWLAAGHPDRLTVLHWLESLQGLPSAEQLAAQVAPWSGRAAFVCGPEAFMDTAVAALRSLGVDRRRVHIEKFVSLSRNPFGTGEAAHTDDSEDCASVEVELDGTTRTFRWQRTTPLLDRLLEKGVDAPYSCREGACSACACRVTEGEVKMLRNEVLEEADLAEGYVLACQAIPVTDEVRVTYS